MSARVLVAGVGNIFLGDDGFGVEVVRRLSQTPERPGVIVADVGIRALHLSYALLDRPDLLLVVDAVSRGEQPGTLYVIDGTPATPSETIPDAHGMNLETVLSAVRSLGGEPPPVRIVGCEPSPDFLGERMGLSPAVENAVPLAMEIVQREIDQAIERLNNTAAGAAEETAS